ncbi:hypothetical protein B0H17DRAFT_1209798 [Mycena rosella]|uniref:Uncharacterized protein n=1 Tax=Mycena rosella TaxID=1033263 RepID=A0AAD7CXR6_MYCRO|nr:hypothetical protein B0H17DRAFT_1209798 [Mycena rosella]
MSSKRHSLPAGPRPLQLVDGPASDGQPSAPLSAVYPSPYSPSPLTPTTPSGARRPSSITYNPAARPARAAGHHSALVRSNSLGGALDRRERDPVTLAEKHADLLHFIAQKESKCLELRSQLAVHEAELLQLKRKWERIVSRGFTSPHNTAVTSPASASSSNNTSLSTDGSPAPTSANGGAVLDGIREVGRFIAAFSPAPYSPAALSSFSPTSFAPQPRFDPRRASGSSTATTTTTHTTASTRRSQSSMSSLDSEPCREEPDEAEAERKRAQVLMVHDHGATPTMSPNPAFAARRERERGPSAPREASAGAGEPARRRERDEDADRERDSSAEAEADFFFAAAQARALSALPRSPGTPHAQNGASTSTSTSHARPKPARPASTGSALPGLALVESVAPAPVAAWVGNMGTSVGRRWEELQRAPGFAKNSKRASLLFSDIAHALQVGGAPAPDPRTPAHTREAVSLLDDDDDEGGMIAPLTPAPLTPALTPTPAPAPAASLSLAARRQQAGLNPKPQPALTPKPQTSLKLPARRAQPQGQAPLSTRSSAQPAPRAPQDDDDDEEWNW